MNRMPARWHARPPRRGFSGTEPMSKAHSETESGIGTSTTDPTPTIERGRFTRAVGDGTEFEAADERGMSEQKAATEKPQQGRLTDF